MIYDARGRPVEPSVKELAAAVGNDIQQLLQMIQILQRNNMMLEMKVNFMIKLLVDKQLLDADLNDKWRDFVQVETQRLAQQEREAELTTTSPDLSLVMDEEVVDAEVQVVEQVNL